MATTSTNCTCGADNLYMSNEALKQLIELIVAYIEENLPTTADTIPSSATEAAAAGNAVPTVLAVFNALQTVDHVKFRLVNGASGQSFIEYMANAGAIPEEMALYFYKTVDDANYDLWIYDASGAGYTRVGYDVLSVDDLDLSNYWSKDELDMTAYWSKAELSIDSITGNIDLSAYAKTEDLENYWSKEELAEMPASDVISLWNEVTGA